MSTESRKEHEGNQKSEIQNSVLTNTGNMGVIARKPNIKTKTENFKYHHIRWKHKSTRNSNRKLDVTFITFHKKVQQEHPT